MKIGYFSDTHFEFQDRNVSKFLDSIKVDGLDLLLLAGDISTLDENASARFIVNTPSVVRQARERFRCPVYAVNGNHEFYFLDMEKYSPDFHTDDLANSVAWGGSYFKELPGGYCLIACTLWTDYCLMGKTLQMDAMAACNVLSDSRLIKIDGMPFISDRAYELHLKDRLFIENSLKKAIFLGLKPIILTHHVPHSIARNPNFPIDLVSAGFYSDLDDLLYLAEEAECKGWIFGHHHWCIEDRSSFKFPLLSAQLGYRSEKINWNGIGILEV
jgi:predicted MPP superfamily phosphohydrolase